MFTGIIQSIGAIAAIDRKGDWTINVASDLPLDAVALGASIACSGICLTVIAKDEKKFTAQLSAETLSKTTAAGWDVGTRLNLERALRLGDELGGHIVSGHVDAVARVIDRQPDGDSLRFLFEAPAAFAKFLAPKGSVTLDGVSLTVNAVDGARFGVNIIPHTQTATTLGDRRADDTVNFEIDVIARYVERMMPLRTTP